MQKVGRAVSRQPPSGRLLFATRKRLLEAGCRLKSPPHTRFLPTLLAVLFAAVVSGQSLQKFRTFYSLDEMKVPDAKSATASDGVVWSAAARGLYRGAEFFAGKRYLPDDEVLGLRPDESRGMWVRTRTGVSHIELRPMTLEQKATAFEERIRLRHDRYGMVSDSHLAKAGDLSTNILESSDNDGLWTAMYGAAECFRYAVTKDPEALKLAKRSIEAVLFLEEITGVPGLPARSYVKKGEARPKDGVWHWTKDGQIQWKGDTSSDEIVGHFFLLSIAYDLLDDWALKNRMSGGGAEDDRYHYFAWLQSDRRDGQADDVGDVVAGVFRGQGEIG